MSLQYQFQHRSQRSNVMDSPKKDSTPPQGKCDFSGNVTNNNIHSNVGTSNSPILNDKIDTIDSDIREYTSFWPDNDDPWGENIDPPQLISSQSHSDFNSHTAEAGRVSLSQTVPFSSGTTIHTTETEYTVDDTDIKAGQLNSHDLQTGSSVTSLSTRTNTPNLEQFEPTLTPDMTIAEALHLYETKLSQYGGNIPPHDLQVNHEQREGEPSLTHSEAQLLQELLTVNPIDSKSQDVSTQVEDSLQGVRNNTPPEQPTQHKVGPSNNSKSEAVTEITMPMGFQRLLRNFAMAKSDSCAPIFEQDWSVSDVGTIDYHDIPPKSQPRTEPISKTASVFANIRSELGDIAYRAKETVFIDSLKTPLPLHKKTSSQPKVDEQDFQSRINERLQRMTLREDGSIVELPPQATSKQVSNSDKKLSTKIVQKDANTTIELPSNVGSSSDNLAVKVTMSGNHFSMNGPWLHHILAFHSLKNETSSLANNTNQYEFYSQHPIEDAIKIATICVGQDRLENSADLRLDHQARRPQKRAATSASVLRTDRSPTPACNRLSMLPQNKSVLSKAKLSMPTNRRLNETLPFNARGEIPTDVWKDFRRPRHGSIGTDTTPERHSLTSSEKHNTSVEGNSILNKTIAQYDGTVDFSDSESEFDVNSDPCLPVVSSSEDSDIEDRANIANLQTESLEEDNKISGGLMESYHDIIHQLSDSDEKSDRELVADQAVWELRGFSQTGSSGDLEDSGGM